MMTLYLLSEERAHFAGHPQGPPRTLPPDQGQRDWRKQYSTRSAIIPLTCSPLPLTGNSAAIRGKTPRTFGEKLRGELDYAVHGMPR